jgi:sporulation protein YlmC with PRC-barrel domain
LYTISTGEEDTMTAFRRTLSAASLNGAPVYNRAGEKLGKVEELMIDVLTGRVTYAVLSFGGVLGIGDKLFAIPWTSLTVDEAQKRIVFDIDKALLENAPGFDKEHWPDLGDLEYANKIYLHYGATPYWD